ncbi:MAG: hypothetical protein HY363_03680 [Candidatus Aenigmarchaeota archaeon]|nr:hypothetical protein [Candidatus Aenigmarchaeota archaeon]
MRFGKQIRFEINDDIFEYEIRREIEKISVLLDKAYFNATPTAIKDLLKDMYESFDIAQKIKEDNRMIGEMISSWRKK